MNKLLNVRHHNLPTDTPSGCFSNLLHCLLCGGTVSTRSSVSSPTPHSSSVSKKFVDLLQNDDQVPIDNLLTKADQLPIVARLMGLETPVDMNWKPRVIDESFNRSRSVNAVDCLLIPHFISPERRSGLVHRRVKTCLSFRESDFLFVCLEKNCDQRADHPSSETNLPIYNQQSRDSSITERTKKSNRRILKVDRRANARRFERTEHSAAGVKSYVEHTKLKIETKSCEGNFSSRAEEVTWQNKDDYYRKRPAIKSRPRTKEYKCVVDRSSKPKSTKHQKDVMDLSSNSVFTESSVSGRVSSSPAQSRKMKERAENVRLRTEDRRRSMKFKTADSGSGETFGEAMIKKLKCIVGRDLVTKRWDWETEGGFLYREYLSMVIEIGILDELVTQIVQDLAFKCDA